MSLTVPLLGVFFAQFDNVAGPRVLLSEPPTLLNAEHWEEISKVVIPKPFLCGSVVCAAILCLLFCLPDVMSRCPSCGPSGLWWGYQHSSVAHTIIATSCCLTCVLWCVSIVALQCGRRFYERCVCVSMCSVSVLCVTLS
jgi:hypothetical protein